MAQIEGEQYLTIQWSCPNCGVYYSIKRIGLTIHSYWPQYLFCDKGCARYFTLNDTDVTDQIEDRYRQC